MDTQKNKHEMLEEQAYAEYTVAFHLYERYAPDSKYMLIVQRSLYYSLRMYLQGLLINITDNKLTNNIVSLFHVLSYNGITLPHMEYLEQHIEDINAWSCDTYDVPMYNEHELETCIKVIRDIVK